MTEMYKVVKEFGLARKGDILDKCEDGLFELAGTDEKEYPYGTVTSHRSVVLDAGTVEALEQAGMIVKIPDITEDCCDCCPAGLCKVLVDTIHEIREECSTLLALYDKNKKLAEQEFEAGNMKECEWVEVKTTYYNLDKVVNKFASIIDENLKKAA